MRIPFSFDLVEMRTGVIPSGINIKINNENIKTMYEICSKLKSKDTLVFMGNFEQISHIALAFSLLTLNK